MSKICQSCGLCPIADENMCGTNADGSKSDDYCRYCFPNGAFNKPDETMEEMVESCAPDLVEYEGYADLEAAKKYLRELYPTLKRWSNNNTAL